MILFDLFFAFFKIGLFAVGGAYSFLPLIEKEVVENYRWLTKPEFLDVLGAIQIFPGAISIKYATYTGYKLAGIPGAIAANLGNFVAPAALIMAAAALYIKYKEFPPLKNSFAMIQLVVFAMILAVAFRAVEMKALLQFRGLLVAAIAFVLFAFTKVHPAFIIVGAGILGALGL
jgi:chromate transporter